MTWLPPATLANLYGFLLDVFPVLTLVTVMVAYFGTLALARHDGARTTMDEVDVRSLSGLASLVFMPLVVITISLLVQPAVLARYSTPVVAAVGPFVAPILARTSRVLLACALAVFLVLSTGNLLGKAQIDKAQKAQLDTELRVLKQLGAAPVLFKSQHTFLMDWRYSPPDRRAHWAMFDPNDRSDKLSVADSFPHVWFAMASNWYAVPDVVSIRTLSDTPAFYLFGLSQDDIDALRGRFTYMEFRRLPMEVSTYQVLPRTRDRESKRSNSEGKES